MGLTLLDYVDWDNDTDCKVPVRTLFKAQALTNNAGLILNDPAKIEQDFNPEYNAPNADELRTISIIQQETLHLGLLQLSQQFAVIAKQKRWLGFVSTPTSARYAKRADILQAAAQELHEKTSPVATQAQFTPRRIYS